MFSSGRLTRSDSSSFTNSHNSRTNRSVSAGFCCCIDHFGCLADTSFPSGRPELMAAIISRGTALQKIIARRIASVNPKALPAISRKNESYCVARASPFQRESLRPLPYGDEQRFKIRVVPQPFDHGDPRCDFPQPLSGRPGLPSTSSRCGSAEEESGLSQGFRQPALIAGHTGCRWRVG